MEFIDYVRTKIRCWREGHDWRKTRVRIFAAAVRDGEKCERCGLCRRISNEKAVEKPLSLTDFKGVIFCPFCGDTQPKVTDKKVVCSRHGTILSVGDGGESDQ